MALPETIERAMNEQVTNEVYSAHTYLALCAYFQSENLPGFAQWMRFQAQEEVNHALKFFDFISDRGGRAVVQSVPQPPSAFASPLDAIQKALEQEQAVTGMIAHLYDLVMQEKDYLSQPLLQWFLTEQVEEEKTVRQIDEMLKMTGGQGQALFLIDRELAKRQTVARA